MIIINKHIFAIAPNNDPVNIFMKEFDPDHIEVLTGDMMSTRNSSSYKQEWNIWGMSLETAEWAYRGQAQWVCPD